MKRGSVGPIAVDGVSVVPVRELDTVYERQQWPFADSRAGEISAHFGALQSKKPAVWNGRVLMLGKFSIADMVFRGSYFSVDYASFLAWRDWGFPDPEVHNCFAVGPVRGSDGAFVLGVMAESTVNAGMIYFPCGTPDHDDIVSGSVNLEGNIRRELAEETGFDVAEFDARPGWVTVLAGPLIANMKLLQAHEDASALRARALDYLARQKTPELADIRIVNGPADLDPMMPPHVVAYLQHMWQSDACTL